MKKLLFSICLGLFSLASLAQAPPNVRLPGDLKSDSTTSRPRRGEYRLYFNALGQPRVLDYLGNRVPLASILGAITGGSGISQSFADGRYLLNTYVPTWSSVTGKPTFFSGNYADLAGKPTIPTLPAWLPSTDPGYLTLTSGDGRYRLATVAIDYTALINKPTIPVVPAWVPTTDPGYLTSAYVPTWTSITGKPSFFSGSYLDLTNRPTLSTVAGTGSYTDLANKPTIPAATVITNNATTTTTGTALDGVWGKILKDASDANAAAIAAKLSIIDTNTLVRKVSGYRLMSSAEITKLANLSGTNTGDQTISISGSRITLSGGGGFVDLPSSGGSGTLPIAYLAAASEFANATASYAFFDGNVWIRSAGTVQTDPVEQNGKYTATQYNGSGSFHYDRQFDGPVNFRWWQRASADNHNRLRAMLSSGFPEMKVDSGTYYFDSYAWTPSNFKITGDLANPGKVKFVLRGANALDNSPNTRIFRGWFWYDGSGIPFENITIEGIRFINECTATITGTPNNATGSNAAIHFDGSVQRNINVNRCEYVQRSKTAATNFAYFKAGPNKLQENIVVSNSRTDNPDSTRARMFVEFVNQDAPNNNKVAGRGIRITNCFIGGVYYGSSIAGNYDNALVEGVTYKNCRDYGSEFAGKNANATLLNCRFEGTHNVLFVSNYHGDNGTASSDPPIPAGSGQQFIGNRTLGYVPGIVELRGSGNLFLANNNLNISGGLYLRANSLGGIISGDLKGNTITTNAIASNMSNKAVVYLEGATNIRATGNTFTRTSADTQPMVQAASSTAQDGATGTPSTGSQFIGNFLYSGAGTLSSYFSAAAPNNLSIGGNYNATGLINQ